MHFSHVVAICGYVSPDDLRDALDAVMGRYNECLDVPLHRDEGADTFDQQLAAARVWAAKPEAKWDISGLTPAQIVAEFGGGEFDTDGCLLTTSNPDGQWDWWVVGGRWGSAWTLRDGAPDGPLGTEPSSFGFNDERRDSNPLATDCARWRDLMPESVTPPYSWIDLDGEWHSKWLGPRGSGSEDVKNWERGDEFGAEFMKFLADLPDDTWLIHVDYHS